MTHSKLWRTLLTTVLCGGLLMTCAAPVTAGLPEVAQKYGKQRIKIACIGDSVTWGVGGTSYPIQLGGLLGGYYEVKNFGISGATARDDGHDNNVNEGHLFGYRTSNPSPGDWNYNDVYQTVYAGAEGKSKYEQSLAYEADIYIISLGGNDAKACNWQNGGENYKEHLRSLVEEYVNLPHHPLVILGTSPGGLRSNFGIVLEAMTDVIVPAQRELAKELGLVFVETFEPTVGQEAYFTEDGVHLNTAGYRVVAEQYYAAITALQETFPSYITTYGDLDGDKQVTSTDARLALQVFAGKIGADTVNADAADVDGDGEITSGDARLILQYFSQKINDFPVNG